MEYGVRLSIVRESWGQGLATEVATACRDHAFDKLTQPRLIAIIHPHNNRAISVALKIGMADSGMIEMWDRENRLFEIYKP